MKDIFEFARKTISDVNEKDYKNMPIIYDNSSNDEKNFIDAFMKKFKPYKKGIIYNEKSGCINFCYNNMQIGRIRLNNNKKRMQILTKENVEWLENISLEQAINNLDKWEKYLQEIIK
ncbi:MAG TPA: hypothetical protein PLT65_05830 [Bacilli bacterium]|nr:hypothetical protein [Bacilli bacterium]